MKEAKARRSVRSQMLTNWEYYAEAVPAGSYRPLYGGDSVEESLQKLTDRLNVIGANGWKLMSIERRTQTFDNDPADPKSCHVFYVAFLYGKSVPDPAGLLHLTPKACRRAPHVPSYRDSA